MRLDPTRSTNSSSGAPIVGSVTPRLWTPPLRDLTPETSYGYDLIDFARDVLGTPLDPWEQWCAIHLGELLPDGRPRFRILLLIVARQNGKTTLIKVLILYWLFVEMVSLVLGTSTDRSYAKRHWSEIVEVIKGNEHLQRRVGAGWLRLTVGEESLKTLRGAEYTFSANNRRAGRSTTLARWACDELREHANFDAWDAATNAMNAVWDAQVVCATNQGDDRSVVLDSLRAAALRYIDTGEGDDRLGILEYSSPDGADPTDLAALAQANPNLGPRELGYRVDPDALLGAALRAVAAGGEQLAGFRTEVMCQRVHQLDPAVDPLRWERCGVDDPLDLAEHRDRVALCYDVSLDGSHASLVAAAAVDGKVHAEVVAQWDGYGCTQQLRRELPEWVHRIRPRALGWFPNGPAAAVAADLADRNRPKTPRQPWPPRRVRIEALKAETAAVCMGLADLVFAEELQHGRDRMLTQHVESAQKLREGDRWVFTRRESGPIDGAYALAGAVHLARTLPPPRPELTIA